MPYISLWIALYRAGLRRVALITLASVALCVAAYFFFRALGGDIVVVYDMPSSSIPFEDFSVTIDRIELIGEDSVVLTRKDIALTFSERAASTLSVAAKRRIPAGRYNGVRIWFTRSEDSSALSFPAEHLDFAAPVTVARGETSAVLLRFQPQYSVYDADGTPVFVPVIGIETRKSVQATDIETASFSGGTIETNATFGTDLTGRTRINFRLVR